MNIAVTLIERIAASAVSADGRHMALTLHDKEANEIILGIPSEQVPCLIDHGARALCDSERILRPLPDRGAQAIVTWWNLARSVADGGFVLSLTFGSGGSLAFGLTEHMAAAMLETLRVHLEEAPRPFPAPPPSGIPDGEGCFGSIYH